MKCTARFIANALAFLLTLAATETALATTASPIRTSQIAHPRKIVYANPTPPSSRPDLPTFAAWSAYLEQALRDQAFMRDSVGLSEGQIDVYVPDDSALQVHLVLLHRLLNDFNLQYHHDEENHMSRGRVRGQSFQINQITRTQAYFDLRDSLLQWRLLTKPSSIDVKVNESPYTPLEGIDSVLRFVEQLRVTPMKDKSAFENYVSLQFLPEMRAIRSLLYNQNGIRVTLRMGRLLSDAEIQAEINRINHTELPRLSRFFNRDMPFVQRMGQFEIMAWIALGLGISNSLLLLFLFWRWRSRRIS